MVIELIYGLLDCVDEQELDYAFGEAGVLIERQLFAFLVRGLLHIYLVRNSRWITLLLDELPFKVTFTLFNEGLRDSCVEEILERLDI